MLIVLLVLGVAQFVVTPLLLWISAKIVRIPGVGLKRVLAAWAVLLLLALIGLAGEIFLGPLAVMLYVGQLVATVWVTMAIFRTKAIRALGCLALVGVLGVGAGLGIKAVAVGAVSIPTGSMNQTILAGDRAFVDKLSLRFRAPRRGEVVIFHPPYALDKTLVKRVIGVAGDKLELTGDVLLVNGVPAGECPIPKFGHPDTKGVEFPVVVPPGKLFLLGDNRTASFDSRFWGFADQDQVVGLAAMIYASVNVPDPATVPRGYMANDHVGTTIRWSRIGSAIK